MTQEIEDLNKFPPTLEVWIAVAVNQTGLVGMCEYCTYRIQVERKYEAWKSEMLQKGCTISKIRARVPIPEAGFDGEVFSA